MLEREGEREKRGKGERREEGRGTGETEDGDRHRERNPVYLTVEAPGFVKCYSCDPLSGGPARNAYCVRTKMPEGSAHWKDPNSPHPRWPLCPQRILFASNNQIFLRLKGYLTDLGVRFLCHLPRGCKLRSSDSSYNIVIFYRQRMKMGPYQILANDSFIDTSHPF